jgi:hypothetical protein
MALNFGLDVSLHSNGWKRMQWREKEKVTVRKLMRLGYDEIPHTVLKGSYTGRYYRTCTRTRSAIFSLNENLEQIRGNGSRSTRSSPGICLPFRQQHDTQEVKLLNKEQQTGKFMFTHVAKKK